MSDQEQELIFTQWLSEHKQLIFKVVRAYADHTIDQQDLFQDICLQLWKSVPQFRNEAKVSTWIYKVSFNTALKWINNETKKKYNLITTDDPPVVLFNQKNDIDPRIAWMYRQINNMTELDRSITLLLLDDYSYKEMAEITGLSLSNIGVKISRIKKSLIKHSKTYQNGF